MRKKVFAYLAFTGTVAVLLLVLTILHGLPPLLQRGTMQPYARIEDVRSRLSIQPIFVPSYFPDRFSWPPSLILAQTRPFTAIVMEFQDIGTENVALVITQSESEDFSPGDRIEIVQMRERVRYALKGRDAVLNVGLCRDGSTCSALTWREGPSWLQVKITAPPLELTRIAESMLVDGTE